MAQRVKLTKRLVDSAKAPQVGEVNLWDSEAPGFGLRLRAGGSRVYVVEYHNREQRKRRLTLGPHGRLTVDQARDRARRSTCRRRPRRRSRRDAAGREGGAHGGRPGAALPRTTRAPEEEADERCWRRAHLATLRAADVGSAQSGGDLVEGHCGLASRDARHTDPGQPHAGAPVEDVRPRRAAGDFDLWARIPCRGVDRFPGAAAGGASFRPPRSNGSAPSSATRRRQSRSWCWPFASCCCPAPAAMRCSHFDGRTSTSSAPACACRTRRPAPSRSRWGRRRWP